ncbi:MAG: hypothetical protein ACRC7B_02890 [Metamycoplasmataceae bacterium]
MKKLFLALGFTPVLLTPLIALSSCSTSSEKTNFKEQYDLFTSNLVNHINVSKNLANSIDDNLIGNIYTIPKTLHPGVTYSFSYLPSEDGKQLKLSVQLYDYQGIPVNYSSSSNEKDIVTITGFRELTSSEQSDINYQYTEFQALQLNGNIDILPSVIKEFSSIEGSSSYIPNPNYKYNFALVADDISGKLSVQLNLTSLDDYPLNPSDKNLKNPKIVQYQTFSTYQEEIDSLYRGENEIINVNLNDVKFSSVNNKLASSITNLEEFIIFYEELKKIDDKINIPSFLTNPDAFKYRPDIKISSNDSNRAVYITIDFYDKSTSNLLTPSPNINRTKQISNFKETRKELLKATIEAYAKYSSYRAINDFRFKLPSEAIINPLPIYEMFDIPEADLREFSITVDDFPESNRRLFRNVKSTFNFKPSINQVPLVDDNDNSGLITYSISLEVLIDGIWLPIKPPSKMNIHNGRPSFTDTKDNNQFSANGFLNNDQRIVNNLYIEINNKIIDPLGPFENLILIDDNFLVVPNPENFYTLDFEVLWASLYTQEILPPKPPQFYDPLKIPINNDFRIKYSFLSNSNNDEYDVKTSTIGNKIYRWVKIKATVVSAFSDFEYEFLTDNPTPPTFEFNFAVSMDK